MSLNPLNELKRRLNDESTPLPKRMCLARNVVQSHHFPTAPKERVVAEWLEEMTIKNKLSSRALRDVIVWLNAANDLTAELKGKLILIVSQYLQKNPLQNDDVPSIVAFLENNKMSAQLILHIDEYLIISTILLKNDELKNNTSMCQRVMSHLIKYYKDCKKKLEFIVKFLDGENLETLFSYLDANCRTTVSDVCQNILFPINKKSFFVSFLQTLIRKDNIDELMAEKGDNIQSVLKIMSAFFTFPKGRTEKNQKFLIDFIAVFVTCFKHESQLIFAFYIMVSNALNMDQSYLSPAMKMPPILFENDDKVKRNLFLNMLEILHRNEIDISVRLTDTFGEKISKVEIKKNFTSFLQAVMMGQLKLEGKLDKCTLLIIKAALKLDPMLIEQKLDQILPPIMTAKKNNSSVMDTYIETINSLMETLFKLSRGMHFVNQILPNVKLSLEAGNTEQFGIKQEIKQGMDEGKDCEKLRSKILTGNDVFPQECVEVYGKWTSELMFRQNKELLVSLQKDFEEHCLMMLEEGFVSPSIITLAEVLSAILCSFLHHNKMADHTVPQNVAEDFWTAYQRFEEDCLGKFGQCILKLSYDPRLHLAFLKLCLSVSHLKLLNMKYSHTKLTSIGPNTSAVHDMAVILPCLTSQQWTALAGRIVDDETFIALDNLLLAKTMALNILSSDKTPDLSEALIQTKTHLIKRVTNSDATSLANDSYFSKVLYRNLDVAQYTQLAKTLLNIYFSNTDLDILKSESVANNKLLLNSLVVETANNITKCLDNCEDLVKALNKSDFNVVSFLKAVDINHYVNQVTIKDNQDGETLLNCINVLNQLPIHYLDESHQLIVIFVLLLTKNCIKSKKLRKNIDCVLQSVFELSAKYPDLYKLFPVKYIFSEDNIMIELLTLRIKTSNNQLIIKCIFETAVKKVKTECGIVKDIVDILISKPMDKITSIENFSDPVFQISCMILPIIAKEKKAITTSAYRSILANLQEKLHKSMLDAFKNIDFTNNSFDAGNIDDSMVVSDSTLATLNAIGAYSLTLSKYCETNDADEVKNLDYLWTGLEFFVNNAIKSIQNPSTKSQHIESSVQLLNVVLRHVKKLESHTIFQKKDAVFIQIWKSLIARLLIVYDKNTNVYGRNVLIFAYLEDITVTLKFICELCSVETFGMNFVADLANMSILKKAYPIIKEESPSQLTCHKVTNYLVVQSLKANIIGHKCSALTKLSSKLCKNLRNWIQQLYEEHDVVKAVGKKVDDFDGTLKEEIVLRVDDSICELLKVDLDTLCEVIFAAKKVTLDYKLLDSIFELQHLIHYIMGLKSIHVRCEISWESFLKLFEGSIAILNSLLMAREELLEDRWPNYMQCYRALLACLCARPAHAQGARLADVAHSVDKLTQSISKRKTHVSRIAAYTIADICALLELNAPPKMVRQHCENSVALLTQAADSAHTTAFLRRALAGNPGHATMTNLYTMYKRYHKYTGNS